MMKKSACIDTLFLELDFYDRIPAAQKAGFDLIEFWDWTDKDLDKIRDLAKQADIGISGFNGDADLSLIDPQHKDAYLAYLEKSLEAAKRIGALSVTIHSNGLGEGGVVINAYPELSDTVKTCAMFDTLQASVKLADAAGVNLVLEALNITTDHVGNYLATTRMGAEICRLIGSPRLKLLYDVYHMQLNEGSVMDTLSAYIDQIGHVHIADAPGRHEPGTGELNYPAIIRHLESLGYQGAVGSELFPIADTDTAVKAILSIFSSNCG